MSGGSRLLPTDVPCRVCGWEIVEWAIDPNRDVAVALPCGHPEDAVGDGRGRRKVRFGEHVRFRDYVPPQGGERAPGRATGMPLWLRIVLWAGALVDSAWHLRSAALPGQSTTGTVVHVAGAVLAVTFGAAVLSATDGSSD